MPTIVIGAGIAGLTRAWSLMQQGRDVVVLEASERAGGKVRSVRRDGVLVEMGPQSLRHQGRATLRLVRELGLQGQIVEARASARRRFILWNGELELLGPKMLLTGRPLKRRQMLRAMVEPLLPARRAGPPETVFGFLERRFGRGVAERLGDPVMAGIFGGDARALEMESAFPPVFHMEQQHGSVIRAALSRREPQAPLPPWAPKTLFTFRDGIETLTRALAERLGDRVRLNTPVERIQTSPLAVLAGGERIAAERVVVAVPPPVASTLLPGLQPELGAMPSAPIAAVHLVYRQADVPPMNGFGWLAPSSELRDALGALWVSSAFPGHAPGHVLVRVMVGGARDPMAALLHEDQLVERCRSVLAAVQDVHAEPVETHVAAHRSGIPQYAPGHAARVRRLQDAVPGVRFLGWGYTGIGVNHCIEAALG